MDTSSYDWLLTARSYHDFRSVNEILNATSVRFDHNIVVAYPYSQFVFKRDALGLCDVNFIYKDRRDSTSRRTFQRNQFNYFRNGNRNHQNEYEQNYYRTSERLKNLTRNKTFKKDGSVLPLFQSGIMHFNYSRIFNMKNASKFSSNQFKKWNQGHRAERVASLIQYFKVRSNSTLYAYYLGKSNITFL